MKSKKAEQLNAVLPNPKRSTRIARARGLDLVLTRALEETSLQLAREMGLCTRKPRN